MAKGRKSLSFNVPGTLDTEQATITFTSSRGKIEIKTRYTEEEWSALSTWAAIMPAAVSGAILEVVFERKEAPADEPDFQEIFQTLRD